MEKRKAFIAVGLAALVALTVHAQQGGGFTGQGPGQGGSGSGLTGSRQVSTVQQATGLRDDSPVILQGRILRSLGDEKYLFADSTGNIVVEIDDDLWRGLTVGENDRIEISGEVDRERNRVEVDVESIRRLQ